MKKLNILLVVVLVLFYSSCTTSECTVDPDLISDLLAPSTDIIKGEPVDWDYVIESVEDNSEDCSVLNAIASISKVVIDFFTDPGDPDSDVVYEQNEQIGELMGGDSRQVSNQIDVFRDTGIYMLAVIADDTNLVKERNEDNNNDIGEVEVRSSDAPFFQNLSPAFERKLEKAAALVFVGDKYKNLNIHSYRGKPIYYSH